MSKANSLPMTFWPSSRRLPRVRDRGRDPCLGLRVLAAQVEVALVRADGEPGDRHRLDDRERVAFEEDAVLEGPGLRLVGVADDVLGSGGLGGDRAPLPTGRERGAAAAHELRRGHLRDDGLGADLEGSPQTGDATGRHVVAKVGRVDHADPPKESKVGRARLADGCGRPGRAAARLEAGHDGGGIGRRQADRDRRLASRGDHRRGGQVAQAQARRAQPSDRPVPCRLTGLAEGPPQVRADRLAPGDPARDVVADVGDDRRPRLCRVQRVERGDAVGLGRWHGQASRDVVQRRLADPADPRLDGVECRQELRSLRPDGVAALGGVPIDRAVTATADPARLGRPEDGVHGGPFGRGGERPDDVQVHRARV